MSVYFDTLLWPQKVVERRREEKKARCHFLGSQRKWVITLLVFAACLQQTQHSSDIKTTLFIALGIYSLA